MTDNLKPREIKFRGWNSSMKRMVYDAFSLRKPAPSQHYISCSTSIAFDEVMQYTGLKDKNGEEIYEGDIVSIEHIYYQGIAQYDSRLEEGFRKIGNYVLKYDDGRFVFSNGLNSLEIHNFWRWSQEKQFYYATGDFVRENDRYGHFSKEYFRFLGLLGNIYENPEILEATDSAK